jgi:hypothetical protein
VSISTPPPGSGSSSRRTVVWRPLPSCARTAPVASRSSPSSALASVDLPVPDRPSSTTVPVSSAASAARPSPVTVLVSTASTPCATAAASSSAAAGSAETSALVSASTGRAPLSQARVSSRSRRPASSRSASETASTTVSTLAASTCPCESREAEARTIDVRRGSSAASSGSPSGPGPGSGRSAAQSPVHGVHTGSGEYTAAVLARSGPDSPTTSHRPRSTPTTRTGVSPAARCSANSRSRSSSQP